VSVNAEWVYLYLLSVCVCAGVCLCLFLLWCVWLQRRSVPVPLDVFKESESVQDPSTFPEAVKQEMRRLLRAVPNGICGVAAPNVRVYTKYLMLRVDGGILLDVFNPVIVRVSSLYCDLCGSLSLCSLCAMWCRSTPNSIAMSLSERSL
jgi:hypothetical protein